MAQQITSQMEWRHEAAQTMSPEHRHMFFQLGSEIQSRRTVRLGFQVAADDCHQDALWALSETSWKSIKSAKALLSVSRMW